VKLREKVVTFEMEILSEDEKLETIRLLETELIKQS